MGENGIRGRLLLTVQVGALESARSCSMPPDLSRKTPIGLNESSGVPPRAPYDEKPREGGKRTEEKHMPCIDHEYLKVFPQ